MWKQTYTINSNFLKGMVLSRVERRTCMFYFIFLLLFEYFTTSFYFDMEPFKNK